jgi:hypothetical protein
MAIVVEVILDRCDQCEYCIFDYDPEGSDGAFWGKHACTYEDPFELPLAEIEIPDECPRSRDKV